MAALDDTIKRLEILIKLLDRAALDTRELKQTLFSLEHVKFMGRENTDAEKLLNTLNRINVAISKMSTGKTPSWVAGLQTINTNALLRDLAALKETAEGIASRSKRQLNTQKILKDLEAQSRSDELDEEVAKMRPSKVQYLGGKLGVDERDIRRIHQEAEAMGVSWDTATMKISRAEQGLKKLTLTSVDSAGQIQKYNTYITQTGKIISETALRAENAAKSIRVYTEAGLRTGLGPGRAEKAMALASRSGFGIQNLTDVYTQQPAGISYLKFAKEVDGVTQKLELTMNKFGEVIVRTNKRLLGFFDAIIRNTGEVLRWSIGVGLVYGTMRKLQDLVAVAIDNQTKLADVTVVLGEAQRDVNEIFDDANEIAQQTGETVNSVIESYTMAYRAVGAIEEPTRRTAAANKLLYDSTILNKLSNLSAAESIDVLSGSLRQLQKPEEDTAAAFDRGAELLDKWVKVTTRANVDLSTLATAFSITSESAENSGMSIEELNAVIAVLSEKIGGLGGRETGNAVRALIGGVYQQQAAGTLAQYGIAVTDTTGKMRDFLDISREIYDLYSSGLISEDELNKIGYVLGGGVRRGQQYIAFLSDLGRVQQIVGEQANSQGAAQDALGKKLDTVATASARLNNSFQSLAQTLGTEGGILDSITGLLKVSTSLVNTFEKLVDILGKFTIPAALTLMLAYVTQFKSAQYSDFTGRLGGMFGGIGTSALGINPRWRDYPNLRFTSEGWERYQEPGAATTYGGKFGNFMGKNFLGFAAGIIPAISRGQQVGGVAGAVEGGVVMGGAIVGTIMAQGNPIGGVIGAAIADAFMSEVEDARGTLESILTVKITPETVTPNKPATPTPEEELTGLLFNRGIPEWMFTFEALLERFERSADKATGGLYKLQEPAGVPGGYFEQYEKYQQMYGEEDARTLALADALVMLDTYNKLEEDGVKLTKEQLLDKTRILRIVDLTNQLTIDTLTAEEQATPTRERQEQLYKDYYTQLNEIENAARKKLQEKLVAGTISGREYMTQVSTLGGLDTEITKVFAAIYGETEQAAMSTGELVQKFQDLSDIITTASPEEIQNLNQLVQEATDLRNIISNLEGTDETLPFGNGIVNASQAANELNQRLETINNTLEGMGTTSLLRNFKAPEVVELDQAYLKDYDMILQKAYALQQEYLKRGTIEGLSVDQGEIDDIVDTYGEIWVRIGEEWKKIEKGKLDPQYLSEAISQLEKAGKIAAGGIGFQSYDMTQGAFAQAMSGYASLLATLTGMGYQPDVQKQIGIFQDGIKPLEYDFKIVQYLLSQILDTEKKQLEGMWNLPEGASFWIPLQTAQLYSQSGGGPALPAGGTEEEKQTTVEDLAAAERERMLVLGEGLQAQGPFNMQSFLEALNSFANKLSVTTPTGQTTQGLDQASRFQFGYHLRPGEAAPPEDTTKLAKENIINFKLEIQSRTQLVVDGRTLADIIKPYLESDMLAAEGQRTITRSVVI